MKRHSRNLEEFFCEYQPFLSITLSALSITLNLPILFQEPEREIAEPAEGRSGVDADVKGGPRIGAQPGTVGHLVLKVS